jgi:ferredoxin-type protein NapF
MSLETTADLSRRRFLLRSEMPAPKVAIAAHCLARRGVYCDSCRDACEAGAIRFVPRLSAVPQPTLDADRCTQCGECVRVCPQGAIRVRPKTGEAVHG